MTTIQSMQKIRDAGIPLPDVSEMLENVITGEFPVGTPEIGYSSTRKEFHPTPAYTAEAARIQSTIRTGYKILESILGLASGDIDASSQLILDDDLAMELAKEYMQSVTSGEAAKSLESSKTLSRMIYPVSLEDGLAATLFSRAIQSSAFLEEIDSAGRLQQLGLLYKLGDEGLSLDKRYAALSALHYSFQ